jgi:hypothetical protein
MIGNIISFVTGVTFGFILCALIVGGKGNE